MAAKLSAAAPAGESCAPAPLPPYAEFAKRVAAKAPHTDLEALRRAYDFAVARHRGQLRASGDPYASHPIEVAGILAELLPDTETIVAGLLHDTVEDSVAEQAEIDELFGTGIGRLVDGVTKLGKFQRESRDRWEAENFRKLVEAVSKDIRVLFVKLADRLHNMRTLRFLDDAAKRLRIARETMEIYAPLAERIGMRELREELEDRAFGEISPDERESLLKRLSFLYATEGTLVPEIAEELRRTLRDAGIVAEVDGRAKQPWSIWRKMEKKHLSLEQIADAIAFRVLVADVAECYRALGTLHGKYPMIPGRFKDYISTPKPNGYRSLHTAVIGPRTHRVEVQIRTRDMHDVAEFGVAAHWRYRRESDKGPPRDGYGYGYGWLHALKDIVEHAPNVEEALEHTKREMRTDRVFCFTPRGDTVPLPKNATPVDFAYAVHSDIGDTCVGAKVNGRSALLRTILRHGDQVEILRSSESTPDPNWKHFAVTGKAKGRISHFVDRQSEYEYASLGRAMLEKAFREEGQEFDDRRLVPALKRFGHRKPRETCAAVGRGVLEAREVLVEVSKVCPELRIAARAANRGSTAPRGDGAADADAVPIKGLKPGIAVHMAECCHPLSGDRIVGIIVEGRGVAVHTIDCQVLEGFADSPERWLDLSWDPDSEASPVQIGRIVATISNVPGSLNALTAAIADVGGNIVNIQTADRTAAFFEFVVDVEVSDAQQLTDIVTRLRANPAFFQVERARG